MECIGRGTGLLRELFKSCRRHFIFCFLVTFVQKDPYGICQLVAIVGIHEFFKKCEGSFIVVEGESVRCPKIRSQKNFQEACVRFRHA